MTLAAIDVNHRKYLNQGLHKTVFYAMLGMPRQPQPRKPGK